MGFFSFALLIELFFKNIKNILIFIISILISGYFLIFYELGGDFFFEQGILHKPSYVFKYIFQYIKILFKHRKNLETIVFIKIFFFLCLPYIIFKILNNCFKFVLFFIHRKTLNSMPIFSAFLLRFLHTPNLQQQARNENVKESKPENKGFFSNLFKKKSNSEIHKTLNSNHFKEEIKKDEFNLRK